MPVKDKPYFDLLNIMRRKGVTQTELCKAIGVNRSSLNAKLNGRMQLNFPEAVAIADYLRIKLEDIN